MHPSRLWYNIRMSFDDIVAVLKRAFKLELNVVEDATAFEVASEDGGTRVKVLVQNADERRKVTAVTADPLPLS